MEAILNGNSIIIPGKDPVKDNPNDVYDTPEIVVRSVYRDILTRHLTTEPLRILDPGAGGGIWGKVGREHYRDAFIEGVELRPLKNPNPDVYWWHSGEDFLLSDYSLTDLVIGNPPYGASKGKRDRTLAEKFIRHSMGHLRDRGILAFLLKTVYLEGVDRGKSLFREFRPSAVYVSSRRINFRKNAKGKKGTNNVSYSMFVWDKAHSPDAGTTLHWWDFETGKVR